MDDGVSVSNVWQNRRPRCERLCQRCAMHRVDDEWLLVFECPASEYLGAARRHLFSIHVALAMTSFMRQQDQAGVLCHIVACLRKVQVMADADHSLDVGLGVDVRPD